MWQTEFAQKSYITTPKPCHKHSLNVVTYETDLAPKANVFTLLTDLPRARAMAFN